MKLCRLLLQLITTLVSTQSLWAEAPKAVREIVQANNAFALDLYGQLARQTGNIVLSPISVDTALAMSYAGAQGNTAWQMAQVLHFPNGNTNVHAAFSALLKDLNTANRSDCKLVIANSLWAQKGYPFLAPYQKLLQDYYGTSLNQIDLNGFPGDFNPAIAARARKQINAWVNQKTGGKIDGLVPETFPGKNTRLILIDAVYFKGSWAKPFDKAQTTNDAFHPSSGKSILIPTMHSHGTFNFADNDDCQMLEVPYKSNLLSMVILLPKKVDGLPKLEKTMTINLIEQLRQASQPTEVNISLPRFKGTFNCSLKKPLQALGMRDVFIEGVANFSQIAHTGLFIEAVIYKGCLEINEEGTEATAATSVMFADGVPVLFNADHPFLFQIRDNATGAILFMGRVANPV